MTRILTGTIQSWIRRRGDLSSDFFRLPGLPLRGERIIVRAFRRPDEERRQQWAKFDDPYLLKYNFARQKAADNELNFRQLQDRIRLAVDLLDGAMIGYISLKPLQAKCEVAELGICFAADQVEKGYGSEALGLVLPWSARSLKLQRIRLEVDAINTRAIHLYRRFGFKQIGTIWRRESNSILKAMVAHSPAGVSGFRLRNQHLEILSWIMEWKADDADAP